MKKVLICSIDNENLKNFNPLLENDNDLRFTFLDLSNLHKNQINYNNSAKIIYSSISLKKPFYLLNILERLKAIYLFNLNKLAKPASISPNRNLNTSIT